MQLGEKAFTITGLRASRWDNRLCFPPTCTAWHLPGGHLHPPETKGEQHKAETPLKPPLFLQDSRLARRREASLPPGFHRWGCGRQVRTVERERATAQYQQGEGTEQMLLTSALSPTELSKHQNVYLISASSSPRKKKLNTHRSPSKSIMWRLYNVPQHTGSGLSNSRVVTIPQNRVTGNKEGLKVKKKKKKLSMYRMENTNEKKR